MATILIIGDNPQVAKALLLLFSLADHDTLTTASPAEGLALLKRGSTAFATPAIRHRDHERSAAGSDLVWPRSHESSKEIATALRASMVSIGKSLNQKDRQGTAFETHSTIRHRERREAISGCYLLHGGLRLLPATQARGRSDEDLGTVELPQPGEQQRELRHIHTATAALIGGCGS